MFVVRTCKILANSIRIATQALPWEPLGCYLLHFSTHRAPQNHSETTVEHFTCHRLPPRVAAFEPAHLLSERLKHKQKSIGWLPPPSRKNRWAAICFISKHKSAPQNHSAKPLVFRLPHFSPNHSCARTHLFVLRACQTLVIIFFRRHDLQQP